MRVTEHGILGGGPISLSTRTALPTTAALSPPPPPLSAAAEGPNEYLVGGGALALLALLYHYASSRGLLPWGSSKGARPHPPGVPCTACEACH